MNAKIVVSPVGTIEETDPLNVRFQVANESTFPIHSVMARAKLEARLHLNTLTHNYVDMRPPVIEEIQPGSKPATFVGRIYIFGTKRVFPDDLIDIELRITFRPSFALWRKRAPRRFQARRLANEQWEWTELAPSTPNGEPWPTPWSH
jgi:hypothetical protein